MPERPDQPSHPEQPSRTLRHLTSDEVHDHAQRLVELQRVAYRVEAALIGDDRIPQLHESAEELRDAGLEWVAGFVAGEPVAALAFTVQAGVLDLHRLVVAPAQHRRGWGRRLVTYVVDRHGQDVDEIVVSTAATNVPALALYRSLGFSQCGERDVLPGLRVVDLRSRR